MLDEDGSVARAVVDFQTRSHKKTLPDSTKLTYTYSLACATRYWHIQSHARGNCLMGESASVDRNLKVLFSVVNNIDRLGFYDMW